MRIAKTLFIVIYIITFLTFIVIRTLTLLAGTEFIIFSYFYWLELIGLILLSLTKRIKSSTFFLISIILFSMSFLVKTIGYVDFSEFLSEFTLVIFTWALVEAIIEYLKHDSN